MDTPMPTPASAVTGQDGDRSLAELLERVPGELLLAEASPAERSAADLFDEVEHDFWTDPCHFLRRACQLADYGSSEFPDRAAACRGLPR